jgi:hypothetical protein
MWHDRAKGDACSISSFALGGDKKRIVAAQWQLTSCFPNASDAQAQHVTVTKPGRPVTMYSQLGS